MDEPMVFQLSRQRHCWVAKFGMDNRWKHLSGKPTSGLDIPLYGNIRTEDPLKTTRLIGQVCKCGNAFSLLVLIGRAAWPQNNLHDRLNVIFVQLFKLPYNRNCQSFSVAMAKRKHPFPSRTRKWSSFAPMVLLGKLSGRVGRCRKFLYNPESLTDSGFFIGVNVNMLSLNCKRNLT